MLILGASLIILSTASYNLINGQPYYYVKLQPSEFANGKLLVTSVPELVLNLDWMDLQKSNPSDWKEVVKRLAGYIRPYWTYPTQSVEMITEDILVMIQNHQWERYRPVKILSNILQELHLMQQ